MSGADFVKLAPLSSLKDSTPVAFDLGKDRVLVVKIGSLIHTCAGKCTHYGAPLEKGLLLSSTITCPWHNARFDVTTGRMLAPPALDHLRCYETRIEDGFLYVRPTPRSVPTPVPSTQNKTFLILGAGAAGNAAAETLRDQGFAGRILLVTPEPDLPYDRPNLSKDFLAGKARPEWIPLRPRKFYTDRNIEFLTGRKAVSLDPKSKTVILDDSSSLPYDSLLLATGCAPRPLNLPGSDLPGVFLLRSRAHAQSILDALPGVDSVVVIGASFIGLEVASSLAQRGLKVHVVAPDSVPLARLFGEPIGKWLQSLHHSKGVTFHLGVKPLGFDGSGRVHSVKLSNGTTLPASLLIAGIGVTPVLDYLSSTSLVSDNSVPVDSSLLTSAPDVFAAGDIASVPYSPQSRRIRIEHWAVAERQGRHAALAMLGSPEPYSEIPFFWTRQFDVSLSYAGLAPSFDRVAYRGAISEDGFLAGYYLADRLVAVASLWRDPEFIALCEILKSSVTLPFERFQDERVSLRDLLPSHY